MCLRSNKKIIRIVLIGNIAGDIFFIILLLLYYNKNKVDGIEFMVLLCVSGILVLMLIGLQYWIAYGREIQLTEEGCIVRFLCFSKLYRWDQMKTKQKIQISTGGGTYSRGPVYNGLLLSCRKVMFLEIKIFMGHLYRVPTYHPFSLIFVMFKPRLNLPPAAPHWLPEWMKQEIDSGYFADEEQLFSLLHSWGVTLDDE